MVAAPAPHLAHRDAPHRRARRRSRPCAGSPTRRSGGLARSPCPGCGTLSSRSAPPPPSAGRRAPASAAAARGRREEVGPRVDGERAGAVGAEGGAEPRRAAAVEGVELVDGELRQRREEADMEGEEPAAHALPPTSTGDAAHRCGRRPPPLARGSELGVLAARPQHATIEHLVEERPREVGPARAAGEREQRDQRAEVRLRLLRARLLFRDERAHAAADRGARRGQRAARAMRRRLIDVYASRSASLAWTPLSARRTTRCCSFGSTSSAINGSKAPRARFPTAAARTSSAELRAEDGQRRLEVLAVEVEREDVRERLAPRRAAHALLGEGGEGDEVGRGVHVVDLARARVDGEPERQSPAPRARRAWRRSRRGAPSSGSTSAPRRSTRARP